MRAFRAILLGGLFVGTAFSRAWARGPSSLFDKPLHETHTPVPLDPRNPGSKLELSCFYYPSFMVKQVDLGEVGAEQLSILDVLKGREEPPCLRANVKDEMVIDSKTWSGYFEGAKGNFVFFVAEDGFNGGLSLAVFSGSDGAKIFEDAAIADMRAIRFVAIEVLNNPESDVDSVLKLRYRRVYVAQCSLRADEKNCWSRIKQITGLTETSSPNCEAAYEAEKKSLPENADGVDSYPSIVTYEVEAVLNQRNSVVRVAPTTKVMDCYLGD